MNKNKRNVKIATSLNEVVAKGKLSGNTFSVNGSTIDVSISSGTAAVMTVGVRVGTAVTFNIPTSNTLDVVGRSSTINVPV